MLTLLSFLPRSFLFSEAKLPNELGKKMRRHFKAVNTNKNALNNSREYDTQEIISKLSNDLKAEVSCIALVF